MSDQDIARGVKQQNLRDAIDDLASDAEETSYPNSDNISVIGFRWLTGNKKKNSGKKPDKDQHNINQDIDQVDRELEDMIKKLNNIVSVLQAKN